MKVQYCKSKKGEWRWRVRAANGKKISASTEGYKRFRDCQRALVLTRDALLYVVPTGGPTKR